MNGKLDGVQENWKEPPPFNFDGSCPLYSTTVCPAYSTILEDNKPNPQSISFTGDSYA
jgi:hypothetical protein